MKRNTIQRSDRGALMDALVENHHKQQLSFTLNGKRYEYKSMQHMLNTLNKIRREEFAKITKK